MMLVSVHSVGGRAMPALGLGTYRLTPTEARKMVTESIELGCRHIDTALMYRNEHGVGLGMVDAGPGLSLTEDELRRLDQLDRGDRQVDPEGAPWR